MNVITEISRADMQQWLENCLNDFHKHCDDNNLKDDLYLEGYTYTLKTNIILETLERSENLEKDIMAETKGEDRLSEAFITLLVGKSVITHKRCNQTDKVLGLEELRKELNILSILYESTSSLFYYLESRVNHSSELIEKGNEYIDDYMKTNFRSIWKF